METIPTKYQERQLPGCTKMHSGFSHVCYCISKDNTKIEVGQSIFFRMGQVAGGDAIIESINDVNGTKVYKSSHNYSFTDNDIMEVRRRKTGEVIIVVSF